MSTTTIISLVLLALIIISGLGLKIIQAKHAEDPEFQRKLQERERAYEKKMEEDAALENMFAQNADEYEDD